MNNNVDTQLIAAMVATIEWQRKQSSYKSLTLISSDGIKVSDAYKTMQEVLSNMDLKHQTTEL